MIYDDAHCYLCNELFIDGDKKKETGFSHFGGGTITNLSHERCIERVLEERLRDFYAKQAEIDAALAKLTEREKQLLYLV